MSNRYPTSTPSSKTRSFRMRSSAYRNYRQAVNHINRMAPEFIAEHPELPWADMRDMRNVVAHAYFAVNLQVVWRTVQEDLPKLKQQIDQLLSQPPPATEPEPRSR
jgi:hypothetical protein